MNNSYRLSSSAFDREKEDEKIEPLKIYFLSVEGNVTEKEYFCLQRRIAYKWTSSCGGIKQK